MKKTSLLKFVGGSSRSTRIGVAVLALAAGSFTSACASASQEHVAGANSSYSGGSGYLTQPQAGSPVTGPEYYQSSDNPFHAD
jgi:hypothetical protein